ncbi:MAG: hypothetical protein ACKO3P_05230, partial [Planctomycetaceae bacterium]
LAHAGAFTGPILELQLLQCTESRCVATGSMRLFSGLFNRLPPEFSTPGASGPTPRSHAFVFDLLDREGRTGPNFRQAAFSSGSPMEYLERRG